MARGSWLVALLVACSTPDAPPTAVDVAPSAFAPVPSPPPDPVDPSPPAPRRDASPPVAEPPIDPGTLEQTEDRPAADDPAFLARIQGLVDAVQAGDPALGRAAFFPLSAYLQVKAIKDPDGDWHRRLLAAYEHDLAQLHTDAEPGKVLRVEVSDGGVRWMDPGDEYNKVGYYRVLRSSIVYEVGGVERRIPVTSLISWRGQWYVVHLSKMS